MIRSCWNYGCLIVLGLLVSSQVWAIPETTGIQAPAGVCFPEDGLLPTASESDCALTETDVYHYAGNLPSVAFTPEEAELEQVLRTDLQRLLVRAEACRIPLAGLGTCLHPRTMDNANLKACFHNLADRLRAHKQRPKNPPLTFNPSPAMMHQAEAFLPSILAEFQSARVQLNWLEEALFSLIRALLEWLDESDDWNDSSIEGLATGLSNLLYMLVMVGLGFLLYLLIRRRFSLKGSAETRRIEPPFGLASDPKSGASLRTQARKELAEDHRREALRLYLLALLYRLMETERLHVKPWHTNRDLLTDLETLPTFGTSLARWLSRFDALWYGGERPSEDETRQMAEDAETTYSLLASSSGNHEEEER